MRSYPPGDRAGKEFSWAVWLENKLEKELEKLKYLDIWHKVLEKWKGCGCSEMKRHVIAIKMCQMSDVR